MGALNFAKKPPGEVLVVGGFGGLGGCWVVGGGWFVDIAKCGGGYPGVVTLYMPWSRLGRAGGPWWVAAGRAKFGGGLPWTPGWVT